MKSRALALFFAIAASSAVAHARDSIEIPRDVDGTLSSTASVRDVATLLVGARWRHLNPDKEHSTWESKWLVFDANGSVDVTTMYAWGPRTVKALWHVTHAGSAPAIEIDGVAYAVSPCKPAPRKTCLVGPRP